MPSGYTRHVVRRVRVERVPESLAKIAPHFIDLVTQLREVYANYTTEQLGLILEFLTQATQRQHDATAKLTAEQSELGH
jgi:hypothetical protein